jgi:hypothetical protein
MTADVEERGAPVCLTIPAPARSLFPLTPLISMYTQHLKLNSWGLENIYYYYFSLKSVCSEHVSCKDLYFVRIWKNHLILKTCREKEDVIRRPVQIESGNKKCSLFNYRAWTCREIHSSSNFRLIRNRSFSEPCFYLTLPREVRRTYLCVVHDADVRYTCGRVAQDGDYSFSPRGGKTPDNH